MAARNVTQRYGETVDRTEIVLTELGRLALDERLRSAAVDLIPSDLDGLLVYGSRARTDFTPCSDLDLLALVPNERGSRAHSGVSLSCYTPSQLRSASGTIFGMHLQRDGIVAYDSTGELGPILASFVEPDPMALFRRIRQLGAVLDASTIDRREHLAGLVRLARYLLRTATYALALSQGRPCFSVRELAERFQEPQLAQLLASDPMQQNPVSDMLLSDLKVRIERIVGQLANNPCVSLQALAVNDWDVDRDRATLAILASSKHGDTFDYTQLPKVLL